MIHSPPVSDDRLDRCLTPRELAKRWRCRPTTVRRMIRSGELPAIAIGGSVRITPEAIAAAERGPLAVRPRRRQRAERLDPEIVKLLDA